MTAPPMRPVMLLMVPLVSGPPGPSVTEKLVPPDHLCLLHLVPPWTQTVPLQQYI